MGSAKGEAIASQKYFIDQEKGVLRNKAGLDDKNEIEKLEAFFVEKTLKNGLSEASKQISVSGLKSMHQEMFGDLYDWAGEFRDYTTGRGLPFCRPEYIETELNKIYRQVNQLIKPNMAREKFSHIAATFIGDLNAIHPFVDGNGRTQRETLRLLAEKANQKINHTTLNQQEWYKAAEVSHIAADYRLFESIIDKATQQTNQ